jgi:hypothetical protein
MVEWGQWAPHLQQIPPVECLVVVQWMPWTALLAREWMQPLARERLWMLLGWRLILVKVL